MTNVGLFYSKKSELGLVRQKLVLCLLEYKNNNFSVWTTPDQAETMEKMGLLVDTKK